MANGGSVKGSREDYETFPTYNMKSMKPAGTRKTNQKIAGNQ
jgi:hypothetical protein